MLIWSVFTQVLLPILVMIGCGWLLDRRCNLSLDSLVKLNIYLFVPAFIFHQVVSSHLETSLALRVVAFTFCMVVIMGLVSFAIGKWLGYRSEQTRSLQLATMFYNSGNYGVPLMSLAYPATGPLLQVFIILVQNVSNFTIGLFLASSGNGKGWRSALPMLRQVSLWAVTSALIVRAFHLPVMQWQWFWVPISYFAQALVGIALITLGAQLSKTPHQQSPSRLIWALGIRLIGGPLVACGLVRLFGFHGETAAVMILSTSFPTAVNTALIAHEFKADAHFAAAAVFYSTVFSMITVTFLIALLRLPQIVSIF